MSERVKRSFKLSVGTVYALILLLLLISIFSAATASNYQVVYHDNQLRHLPTMTMTRNGVAQEVKLPVTVSDVRKGEQIVLTGKYQTKRHDSLMVKVEDTRLAFYVDNSDAYSIKGEASSYPVFQNSPAPDIMFVALPNEDSAKTLRFEYTVSEDMAKLELQNIFLGENNILFGYLTMNNTLPFVLGAVLIFSGILIIAYALLVRRRVRQISSMIWLGAASSLAGLVGFCSNDLAIYLITAPNLLHAATIVGITLFPVPFLQYAKRMLEPTHKTFLRIIQLIVGAVVLVLLALRLFGIVPGTLNQLAVQIILVLSITSFTAYVLYESFSKGTEQAKLHVIPAIILSFCMVANIIDLYAINFVQDDLMFQVGIFVFILWATAISWNYMRQLFEEAERSIQLELEVAAMNSSLDMQRSLYQSLSRSTDEVRRVRHDLRHQLSAIRGYLQKGNVEGAIGYVETISDSIPNISSKLLCDNFAVNAVAVYYLGKALEDNIKTDLKLAIPEDLGQVSDNDMCIIMGNLFENAIEACRHLDEDERFISIKCKILRNRLTMAIDNSYDGNYSEKGGSLYSRKREGKGVGVSSVKAVVGRYSGSIKLEATEKVFMVSLYIKMS